MVAVSPSPPPRPSPRPPPSTVVVVVVVVITGCRTPLYEDSHKFDCGCGWPGFWTNIQDAVFEKKDADGRRAEIMCSGCSG